MEKKMCSVCGLEKYIVNKTKCLCDDCNYKRLHDGMTRLDVYREKNSVKRYKKKRNTGESEMFKEIWNERPHVCIRCGKNLGEEAKTMYFSHIRSKGAYPELRLVKNNIEILCEACHHAYEFGSR